MENANLIPKSRREEQARRRRLRRWAKGLPVYGGLLLAAYVACWVLSGDDREASAAQLRSAIDRIRRASDEIQSLRRKIEVTQRQITTARAAAKHPDWSLLLTMLADRLGDDVVLSRCRLEPVEADGSGPDAGPEGRPGPDGHESYLLHLSGLAKTQAAASRFVLRLEQTGLFDSVRLVRTERKGFGDGQAVAFELVCHIDQKGGADR